MSQNIDSVIDLLIKNENFKGKIEEHLINVMKDHKLDTNDIPELILMVMTLYNNISTVKLAYSDIPSFINLIIKRILKEKNLIPEENEDIFFKLLETTINLVMLKPKVKKCLISCCNF
jgi:hypothetical protein